MSLLKAAVLGIVQGATEFLPVSSSGHLTLAEMALGIETGDNVALDVALHGATLLAIFVYFGRAWFRRIVAEPRLAVLAVAAGVPAGALYLAAGERINAVKLSLWAVGGLFIAGGGFLAFASIGAKRLYPSLPADGDPVIPRGRRGALDVLAIGLAQAAALFPGVSRSGSTMGAGLLLGLTRAAAFEFSFLAAAPLLLGAVLVKAAGIHRMAATFGGALAAGSAVAFVTGLAALALLKRVVVRGKLWAFGFYTMAAGLGCLAWAIGSAS